MASAGTRLNLGCGDKYLQGWVNVDLYAPMADYRVDLRKMEMPAGTVAEAVCFHVIEHLTREDGVDLIRRVLSWLEPGGTLAVEWPEYGRCLHAIRRGQVKTDSQGVRRLLGGAGVMGGRSGSFEFKAGLQKWIHANRELLKSELAAHRHVRHESMPPKYWVEGENHLYIWEQEEMLQAFRDVGFVDVSCADRPESHGGRASRDCRVVGVKA